MAQFARPSTDHTNIGPYTDAAGGTTDLWQGIDEVTPSDADRVESPSNPAGTERYSTQLTSITDPGVDTGHTIRYRIAKSASAGRTIDVLCFLVDGDTETDIVQWTHLNISNVFATTTQTLSTGQAAAITNYSNIRFRFDPTASGGGGGREAWLSWMEMEVPDAPPPASAQGPAYIGGGYYG